MRVEFDDEGAYESNFGEANPIFPRLEIAEDGAEQDVYILGTDLPLREFEGKVIAVYRRFDDVEDKWIVSLDGKDYPDGVILEAIHFQEQYFHGELLR